MQAWNIGDLLPPFSIAYIKGWRRTVAAFICCQAIRELELWDEISAELKAGVNVHLSPKPYKARKECLPAVLGKTSQILKLSSRHAPNAIPPMPSRQQASLTTVHVTVGRYGAVEQQVATSRGTKINDNVSCNKEFGPHCCQASAWQRPRLANRRMPSTCSASSTCCRSQEHRMMIWVTLSSVLLCCVGLGKRIMKQCHCSAFEGWDSKTAYARAFKIGQAEAGAVKNLRCNVSKETLTQLQEAARLRGVARFVTHDLVSKSCFNEAWMDKRHRRHGTVGGATDQHAQR